MIEPVPSRPNAPSSYGIVDAESGELLPWSWAVERLERSRGYWLSTVTPESHPHMAPMWGVFIDPYFCFGTDVMSRKARNLEDNRNVCVAIDDTFETVFIEGTVEAIPIDMLDAYFAAYSAKYDLPIEHLNAAGSFRVVPTKAFGYIDDERFPNIATRWMFTST